MSTQAGWHPDPWQRSQVRYFDGARWTEQVSNNGVTSIDAAALSQAVPPQASPVAAFPVTAAAVKVKKKRHTFRWLVLGLVGVIVIVVVATGSKTKTTATTTAGSSSATNTVSKGAGARDATADVSDLRLADPDAIGFREVMAKITNNSSKRSNYFVNVAIESADGKTQIDTATLFVNSLEPGQSTEAKGISTSKDVPADAKLTLKSVTRLAAT